MKHFDETDEETILGLGTRKGTRDKLTYRQVLYNVIMQYLNSYGNFNSRRAVEKIIHATRFNEPGFELKNSIDTIKEELQEEKKIKWNEWKKQIGKFNFSRRSTQSKLKIQLQKWYWDELFDRILQVLADKDLIIEHNKLQKIRVKGTNIDDDYATFKDRLTHSYE